VAPGNRWAIDEISRLSRLSGDADHLSFTADELKSKLCGLLGPDAFDKWLVEAIESVEADELAKGIPEALVQAIIGLECPLATTNYDRILERHTNKTPIAMNDESNVSDFMRGHSNGILHLHGVVSEPKTIVLGRRSYEEYVGNKVSAQFQRALSTIYSCLFVGFGQGLEDLNFAPWFNWIRDTLAKSKIKHNVLLNEQQTALWRSKHHGNIDSLSYGGDHTQLPQFLLDIKRESLGVQRLGASPRSVEAELDVRTLDDKIGAKREGKEAVAIALHKYVVDRLQDNKLHCYAVKYRIKSHHSIWNKVKEIQASQPSLDVAAILDRIRDIIGIRVLTLYRVDLKTLVREVAGWFNSPMIQLPVPFNACLEEVKIFGSEASFNSDSPHQIILPSIHYFEEMSVPITRKSVTTSYSAFHLCCSYIGEDGKRSFFEIQMRSALEDIWSEIEHPLRYKPVDGRMARSAREAEDLRLAQEHLQSLKSLIDAAAQYADTIRAQINQINGLPTRQLATYTLSKTDRLNALLKPSTKSRYFCEKFSAHFASQTAFLEKAIDGNEPIQKLDDRAATSLALFRLGEGFRRLLPEIPYLPLKNNTDPREVELIVLMEQALCLFEAAVRNVDRAEEDRLLRESLDIYLRNKQTLEMPDAQKWAPNYHFVALYRLARLHYRLGYADAALDYSKRAFELVSSQKKYDASDVQGNRLKLDVVRYRILLLQDKAETLNLESVKTKDPGYLLEERRRLYSQMTHISLDELSKLDGNDESLCNTALFGAAEYAALGSTVWGDDLALYNRFETLWSAFKTQGDFLTEPAKVHTAFRYSQCVLLDKQLTRTFAKRLINSIEARREPDEYHMRDLAQARDWIARHPE
jgi:ppGpp synthetase/RelA/SpoT-type nucleotidyltranferase